MSRTALQELSTQKFLRGAWQKMFAQASRTARLSQGLDGVSLNNFETYKSAYLKELSDELRTGRYHPLPLTPHFIPKANGKDRVICVPAVRDRLVQRALVELLHAKGYELTNSISYGFVRGRSVKKAAVSAITLRAKQPWAYKADISAFFDRIDRTLLTRKIQSTIKLRSIHPLLLKIVHTEISAPSKDAKKRIKKLGIKEGEGLRQGMPISPYLANLMLHNFDSAIIDQGFSAIRYADDLIAFGNNRAECEAIHEHCVELLNREKLAIYPLADGTKTTIARPSEVVEFLGLGLSPRNGAYELIVTPQQLMAIDSKLMMMTDINRCVREGITLTRYMQRLEGKVSGFKGAYDLCQNKAQLEHRLLSTKNRCLKKVLNQLGIEEAKLTTKHREFLGIEQY